MDHRFRSQAAESGFSLMEVVVSTAIAAIAVIGLAYTFGLGRGQIERFSLARMALGAAEAQMSVLGVLEAEHPMLVAGQHDSAFVVDGLALGEMRWFVSPEPMAWTVGTVDYEDSLRRVLVEVSWDNGIADTVRLTRLFER